MENVNASTIKGARRHPSSSGDTCVTHLYIIKEKKRMAETGDKTPWRTSIITRHKGIVSVKIIQK